MKIREFKENDWFFNEDGKLCQMMNVEYRQGSYNDGWCYTYTDGYFETTCGGDSNAYALTIENKNVADRIREYYDKFHKNGILYPKTSKKLELFYEKIMDIIESGEDMKMRYPISQIYDEIENYMKDLKFHISFFKEVI